MATSSRLPLAGVKVLELAGLAPVPFAGMILSDFGAQVTRIARNESQSALDSFARGKRSICLDLKSEGGKNVLKRLSKSNDILIEPYRAGVMERLGLGPEIICEINEKLIYVRLNGFGSKGSLSSRAGHDINYLAISGILSKLGLKGHNPSPPINLLGDFGGGSLIAVLGILMALLEQRVSGKGQVVETSITEGTAYLSSFLYRSKNIGIWHGERGENLLDGGAPFYQTYMTKDGKYMAVGALENQFYTAFIEALGLEDMLPHQMNIEMWPNMIIEINEKFKSKTQSEWMEVFEDIDACVTPVLDLDDAPYYSHNIDNATFMGSKKGKHEPCPAPKLSRTPAVNGIRPSPKAGEHTVEVLSEEGFSEEEIDILMANHAIQQSCPQSLL